MPNIAAAPPAPGDPQAPASPLPDGGVPFGVAPPAPNAAAVAGVATDTLPSQAPGAPDAAVVLEADLGQREQAPAPAPPPPEEPEEPEEEPEAPTGVAVSGLTAAGATITWETATANRGRVEYGTTEALGSTTPQEASNTTSHARTLSGLAAETTYYFSAGTATASATGTFTTPAA